MTESETGKRVIEINGTKFEVDMRQARRVDEFRVGDRVKLLKKRWSGSDTWESYFGVIAGFDDFKNLPTVIVAYLDPHGDNSEPAGLRYCYFNANSKDAEICASADGDLPLKRAHVLRLMEAAIEKKRMEVRDLEERMAYFKQHFERWFPEIAAENEEAQTA